MGSIGIVLDDTMPNAVQLRRHFRAKAVCNVHARFAGSTADQGLKSFQRQRHFLSQYIADHGVNLNQS